MSNDNTIPTEIRFWQPTRALTATGMSVKLMVGIPYKVLEVKRNNVENDYGYLIYTRLVIQREGGKQVTIPWGTVEAVAC